MSGSFPYIVHTRNPSRCLKGRGMEFRDIFLENANGAIVDNGHKVRIWN